MFFFPLLAVTSMRINIQTRQREKKLPTPVTRLYKSQVRSCSPCPFQRQTQLDSYLLLNSTRLVLWLFLTNVVLSTSSRFLLEYSMTLVVQSCHTWINMTVNAIFKPKCRCLQLKFPPVEIRSASCASRHVIYAAL